MKNRCFLFALILIVPFVFAGTSENVKFEIGNSVVIDGMNITLKAVGVDGKYLFDVNGVGGIIGNHGVVNAVTFDIAPQVFDEFIHANVSLLFVCGDGNCSEREDSSVCCLDCGCEDNYVCSGSYCKRKQCVIDKDCDDENSCTVNVCSEDKFCMLSVMVDCVNDDGCCPVECSIDSDNDCPNITLVRMNHSELLVDNSSKGNESIIENVSVEIGLEEFKDESESGSSKEDIAERDEVKNEFLGKLFAFNIIAVILIIAYFYFGYKKRNLIKGND